MCLRHQSQILRQNFSVFEYFFDFGPRSAGLDLFLWRVRKRTKVPGRCVGGVGVKGLAWAVAPVPVPFLGG